MLPNLAGPEVGQSVGQSKIGVLRSDLKVESSDCGWKIFLTNFGQSRAKSPESTAEFAFGRSVG